MCNAQNSYYDVQKVVQLVTCWQLKRHDTTHVAMQHRQQNKTRLTNSQVEKHSSGQGLDFFTPPGVACTAILRHTTVYVIFLFSSNGENCFLSGEKQFSRFWALQHAHVCVTLDDSAWTLAIAPNSDDIDVASVRKQLHPEPT